MPAGRPRAFDTDAALERAMELFWRRGFEGASLAELTGAMGINRPSLYAAFGDKEGLFLAVLDRYAAGPASFVGVALAEPSARRAVERLLTDAARELTLPGRPPGCLAVQGALVCSDEGSAVQTTLAQRRKATEAAIRERLEQAVATGDLLPEGPDPARLASFVATIFMGMAVQATGGAARETLESVAALALAGLRWP